MTAHEANGTWKLVPRPKHKKVLPNKWVYKRKRECGKNTRHRARLVIKGCNQRWGIDYFDTYAPVVRTTSMKLLVVEAFLRDWHIDHLDVANAYLNGDLEEEVYMNQPAGHVNQNHPDWVCKLLKALYGLKQAGRKWHEVFVTFLKSHGYKQSKKDPCVLVKIAVEGTVIIILYVDDIIPLTSNLRLRQETKRLIQSRFKTRDLGPLKQFVGIEITRTKETLSFAQPDYSEKILERFRMQNAKPNKYPLNKRATQSGESTNREKAVESEQKEATTESNFPYREAVGSLMYLATQTRPDMALAVNTAAMHQENPTAENIVATQGETPDRAQLRS